MPTRILVDLLGFTGERGGTETYARELLTRLPGCLPDARWVALVGRAGADRVRAFFPGPVRVIPWVGADAVSWAAGAVGVTAVFAHTTGADVVWAPANFGPIFRGAPRVVTVHDAIYDDVPGTALRRAVRTGTSFLMRRSARTADRVITVSRSAAHAIEHHFAVPRDRIEVVPNGSSDPRPVADARAVLTSLGVGSERRILMSTGNRMPHKNFEGLLEALATIPRTDRPLTVIAGSRSPDPLLRTVERLGLTADVVLPGWIGDAELEALYQVADLYVCPSLVEGFGLPVVDALRRRVPVLANDIPVLREVGGSVVRYTDATSPVIFGAAITTCLRDQPDDAALERAASWADNFSWAASARATGDVLLRTARERSPAGRAS
ncbi:hypothetical protein GCM10023065_08470 [Microbacterium laevaniformans]|uniref:glycosyltransferase family 4 protein n=1 Tax=Microbacterium laevaniformans TaxID=36807 RepID=UPI00195CCAEA|nr:glycosyltransferase family 1 protein [Microbacterium laevaniformans]MBM7751798.1 glycosyltransferase involved in cell wall biosynthesis [Microbacterium laevaniformans]GLJ63847.1 hypothetical protein GCM10017578_07350 [Microbacterium laevaniformans]